MKTILQSKTSSPASLTLAALSTIPFVILRKDYLSELGYLWIWWAMVSMPVIIVLILISRPFFRRGDIEIEEKKFRIKDYPRKKWIFGWDQIEGFGTKKVLFTEYPTIKPKPLLLPKDEIVIPHRYKKSASEVADFLNKCYQNKAFEMNAE